MGKSYIRKYKYFKSKNYIHKYKLNDNELMMG